jgi:hypothetical protein
MTLTMALSNNATTNAVVATVTGISGTTVVALTGQDHAGTGGFGTLATGTVTGTTGTVSVAWPKAGLHYFQLVSGTNTSAVDALWLGDTGYQRDDLLSDALRDILVENVVGITSAWRQFAAAATYIAGTVTASDIHVGDRLRPTEGRVTICVMSDKDDFDTIGQNVAIGDFSQISRRMIRGYVDLSPTDETTQRETERERLRDTLRSAIVDILLSDTYQTITDDNGWAWYNCRPVDSDVGEIVRDGKFRWAFEITWQAETLGSR